MDTKAKFTRLARAAWLAAGGLFVIAGLALIVMSAFDGVGQPRYVRWSCVVAFGITTLVEAKYWDKKAIWYCSLPVQVLLMVLVEVS